MNRIGELTQKVASMVGWLLVISAMAFYSYGLVEAITITLSITETNIKNYPEFLSTTMASIQAMLLTNLGVVLGISVTNPGSGMARAVRFTEATAVSSPLDSSDIIQLGAIIVFLLGLIACVVVWAIKDFSYDPKVIVSVIPESGKMFAGVVLAYMALALKKR
jgi:hypothetical protein